MNEMTMREIDFALAVLPYIGAVLLAACLIALFARIVFAAAGFIRDWQRYVTWRLNDDWRRK